jgi:hypothetical protein
MAAVHVDSYEALSRTNVSYRVELRLQRSDCGEPVWVTDLLVTSPGKDTRSMPRYYWTREEATREYCKYQSLLLAIDNQRLGVESGGQISMLDTKT